MAEVELKINEYLNDNFALSDENTSNKENCQNYKISVFLAFKPIVTKDMFKDIIMLEYPKDVSQIILEDELYSIGLRGYMDVINEGSQFDIFLNKANLFYVVINITEYNSDNKPIVKYEPYIFDVKNVVEVSQPGAKTQVLRIGLVDIITSIFEQHSIASVIQYNKEITTCGSYKKLFEYLFDYVKDHIRTNLNNTYNLKKELIYKADYMFIDKVISGNDAEVNMEALIKHTFGKIKRDATIQEALQEIYKDACTTLSTPEKFSNEYEMIANVLIPFFFKEEYPDPCFVYTSTCSDVTNAVEELPIVNKQFSGEAPQLLYRQMTMRDIYMPFLFAFGSESSCGIFEDINPQVEDAKQVALNGVYKGMIYDIKYNSGAGQLYKLWKNIIFLSCAGDSTSGDSVLIFFSWFYDYFTNVFLNESITSRGIRKKQSNVTPAFHAMMAAHDVPHSDQSIDTYQEGFVCKIDEHNSFIYPSQTEDTLNECMRVMGKNVASFILANDSYKFTIQGSIRRRPNEIIKFGFDPAAKDGSISNKTVGTDINYSKYTYLYVKKIIHKFVGNEYKNTIEAHKFADIFDPEA